MFMTNLMQCVENVTCNNRKGSIKNLLQLICWRFFRKIGTTGCNKIWTKCL